MDTAQFGVREVDIPAIAYSGKNGGDMVSMEQGRTVHLSQHPHCLPV